MPVYPELTPAGLVTIDAIQHLENMREGIAGSSEFGAAVSTGPFSIVGQLLGVVSAELGELNELDQAIYDSQNPDNAQGLAADNVNAYRGVQRQSATASRVSVSLTGTASTLVPAGKKVRQTGSSNIWTTLSDVVIPGDTDATCDTLGPITALATSIDEIFTPVTGWTGVSNSQDAVPGRSEENDTDYLLRGERSLSRGGSSTDQSMRARLEDQVAGVEAAAVRSNRTGDTTVDGQPPHSLWAVVYPNTVDPDEVALAMWGEAGAPQGIEMYGAQSAGILDDQDYTQTMQWDWGTNEAVRIRIYLTKNSEYPSDGDLQVRNAVAAWVALYTMGQDVEPAPIQNAVQAAVPGIAVISSTQKIGSTPGPTDTAPVVIDFNKVATVLFSEISVVAV